MEHANNEEQNRKPDNKQAPKGEQLKNKKQGATAEKKGGCC